MDLHSNMTIFITSTMTSPVTKTAKTSKWLRLQFVIKPDPSTNILSYPLNPIKVMILTAIPLVIGCLRCFDSLRY